MSKPIRVVLLVIALLMVLVPTAIAEEAEVWPYVYGSHYADPQNENGDASWKIIIGEQYAPPEIEVIVYGTNIEIDGIYRIQMAEYKDGAAHYKMAYALFESSAVWQVRAQVHPDVVIEEVVFEATESSSVPFEPPEGFHRIDLDPKKLEGVDVEGDECMFLLTSQGNTIEFPKGVFAFVMKESVEDDGLPFAGEYREFFWIPQSKQPGKAGHYGWDPFPYYLPEIAGAWTVVPNGFSGQFNISHCPQQALAIELVSSDESDQGMALSVERVDFLYQIETAVRGFISKLIS